MLTEKQLIFLNHKLIQTKQEMLQVIEGNQPITFEDFGELTSYDNHFADQATELDEIEKQKMIHQTAKNIVDEVDKALERMREGTYGLCIDTGEGIPFARLEALPYAKRTVEAQAMFEKDGAISFLEEKSFSTPKQNTRGDTRIQTADELMTVHGNSSS
ncbi:TraR/DksA C4-type zinc finger protein [Paenibacillus sp. BSR1-1]|uniref:TraR/DksA C4-type zinc finger protein n=1 Tax=Paenibacillus sp. BSR1-1 TaxID=3020845 RepID=UPI0025B12BA8|nr:TraR/DksA C4-type zinc finger protein [Paenibacillus sp. BSR1-1]MDN3018038.1 TraR/DksA C4-type zinc finger protein [Paenibacillus sp. BSR1-1]